jgi:fluoride ion exporter CrcB/FEX
MLVVPFGVAIGGAFGAVSRYGIDVLIDRRSGAAFPWSTFVINVLGCLAAGFIIAALVDRITHRSGFVSDWLSASAVGTRRSRPLRRRPSISSRHMTARSRSRV